MTETWISADTIFDGERLLPRHAILVGDGRVQAVRPASSVQVQQHHVGILMPGFFDIQVNGGGGALLNTSPTVAGLTQIAAAHRALGTVALMPTVITDAPEVLAQAVDTICSVHGTLGIVGLHIEGPHLSRARRGTHDARYIRPMAEVTMALVRRLKSEGVPVLITVAPESVTPQQIAALVSAGAVVSLGHSDADAVTTREAMAAGATGFTHLYNAMSPMQHRAPGMTGAAIASDAWCSIIADGKHVDPAMVALACRARPRPDRMIAISDAMATVGGPDTFTLYDQSIRLQDSMLINSEGALAGAHLTMAEAVANLISYGISPLDALRMGRHNPAQMMGIWDKMAMIGMRQSDLILLDETFAFVGPLLAD